MFRLVVMYQAINCVKVGTHSLCFHEQVHVQDSANIWTALHSAANTLQYLSPATVMLVAMVAYSFRFWPHISNFFTG